MTRATIPKRALKNVGLNIWDAIAVMEQEFGARLTHDSGHDKGANEKATTWIFDFPRHGDAQIAVAMNKKKLSFVMRDRTVDGRSLESLLGDIAKLEIRQTNSEKGLVSSVLGERAPYLNPSTRNPILRVAPRPDGVRKLLCLYLGAPSSEPAPPVADETSAARSNSSPSGRGPLSEEDLQTQLDRQSEVGKAGEMLTVLDELERLRACGCPDPERHVRRKATTDVGCGYDIESTWPGEERCIEVKSTTRAGSDFFITTNERTVLAALGERAWLYRVKLDADGHGIVETRLRNPMKYIGEEQMTPVVWRVPAAALTAGE